MGYSWKEDDMTWANQVLRVREIFGLLDLAKYLVTTTGVARNDRLKEDSVGEQYIESKWLCPHQVFAVGTVLAGY